MNKATHFTSDSPEVIYLKSRDRHLAKVIELVGTVEAKEHNDPYAFLVHEIIEQMLSVKAGAKIFGRLEIICGGSVTPNAIENLSDAEIRNTGMSNAKVEYIRIMTKAVTAGDLVFSRLEQETDTTVLKTLTSFRGIGNWTAKMYLIFVLGRLNVLPYEDGAFLQTYRWMYKTNDVSPASIKKRCNKWSPYTSIAARFMYRALDMGLTKQEFHLHGKSL